MIGWIIFLFLFGLALSALFSGSETGFYRIPRVRLRLDALGGDWFARGMLWMTNHASLFVATTLIGNNIANYCTALAIVMAVNHFLDNSTSLQVLAPIVFSPILFVYGELLPKSVFYYMPNRLLRRWGPLLAVFSLLLLPFSGLFWAISRLAQTMLGEPPQRLQWRLARTELTRILKEGHQAGILRPSQRRLAEKIFAIASRPIVEFGLPAEKWRWTREGIHRSEALALARKYELDVLPVESADEKGHLVGYIRVPELYIEEAAVQVRIHPLLEISDRATHLATLMEMRHAAEVLARIVDPDGVTVGFVTSEQLCEPLFRNDI